VKASKDGRIWVATGEGCYVFRERVKLFRVAPNVLRNSVGRVSFDANGEVFLAGDVFEPIADRRQSAKTVVVCRLYDSGFLRAFDPPADINGKTLTGYLSTWTGRDWFSYWSFSTIEFECLTAKVRFCDVGRIPSTTVIGTQ